MVRILNLQTENITFLLILEKATEISVKNKKTGTVTKTSVYENGFLLVN